MLGLLAALGIVAGLVRLTLTEKSGVPVLRPALQRRRLAKILHDGQRRRLTRTEAEDGLVLARRLGEARLARRLEEVVRQTKRQGTGAGGTRGRSRNKYPR